MKNLLKLLPLIFLSTSCNINHNIPNKNEYNLDIAKKVFEMKQSKDPLANEYTIFMDFGKEGKLDDQDILLVYDKEKIIIYSEKGVIDKHNNKINIKRSKVKERIKNAGIDYFNIGR
ncbi:hypothetical protein HOD29_05855 [archaeon]|jgi:hypothetical protein|nr:hypothetical protein [archaeon]